MEAASQADEQFVTQAEELKRPGSGWSYDAERYALRAVLEGGYRREAAVAEEHRTAARSQQSTVEIISRLQGQMENLQQRLQHMRAGQPWFISSSYRIPGTPITMIGRFQQGRASIEMNLAADRHETKKGFSLLSLFQGSGDCGSRLRAGCGARRPLRLSFGAKVWALRTWASARILASERAARRVTSSCDIRLG